MKPIDPEILVHLNNECDGEAIHFVGLGSYDFQVSFAGIEHILAKVEVAFWIGGKAYTWEEGPSECPIGMLVGQVPSRFEIPSPFTLRMCLMSGDHVDFLSDESPYEAIVIDFGTRGDSRVMEIF